MSTYVGLRSRMLLGAIAFAAALSTSTIPTTAQQRALPHDLLMSREQIAALVQAWNDRLPYLPGEVLVKFRDGVEATGQVRALSALRAGIEQRNVRWIGDVLWLRAADEPDAQQLAAALQRQPEVLWAQPNYFRRTSARPNDPSYASHQWNFDLIDMPRTWDINGGATNSITIAVLDSGVTTVNDTFGFPLWTGQRVETVPVPFRVNPDIGTARILPGRDFIFWNGPVLDMDGHGTHVAGTALEETNNSVSLAGIAYNAKLMPLKVCVGYWEIQIVTSASGIPGFVDPEEGGGCSDSAITQAIRYAADNGAQMINLSLGGEGQAPAMLEALRYAIGRGVFVAMAMGNEFEDGNPTEYPAAYGPQVEGAVAVGAVGSDRTRAFYSNTGSHIEIAAPGGNPRDGNPRGFVWQQTIDPRDSNPFTIIRPRFDNFVEVGIAGTSMATPHVTGVAALAYSQGINNPGAIEAALERFATDLGAAGRDNDFGAGLVNPRATLRGFGVAK